MHSHLRIRILCLYKKGVQAGRNQILSKKSSSREEKGKEKKAERSGQSLID
jgi:hypothetical protein